jgi:uncharacterized protein YjiS (DUF1127 family)
MGAIIQARYKLFPHRNSADTSRAYAASRRIKGAAMKQIFCSQTFRRIWARLVAARQRRATQRVLRHLDARTLKDIGLESYAAASRRQDALAWRAGLSFGGLR